MKNLQRPTGRRSHDGQTLLLHSIFYTIQGEGPHAGRAAIFVRLAGCNLQCPLCDTEYTAGAQELEVGRIVEQVYAKYLSQGCRLVVLTGGEPFRQNTHPLLQILIDEGFEVQIETNGMLDLGGTVSDQTLYQLARGHGKITTVVSPKTHKVAQSIRDVAEAWKFVISNDSVHPGDLLPLTALNHPIPTGQLLARRHETWEGPVYVQPADEQDTFLNAANMEAAVNSVMTYPQNRRLCLQMHKYADLE
jgi:organic radical activating enzyme